eukprot:CAMPEP_0170203230 /NCGR_PEP_ID=MMETSP0116_2-20130129/1114_1 /TAXON_ID=400756 /ORGANISM="Durinskia baltica, Strain CSIRO CS-38" /LENGTH=70 /DNA_ID=CAMNT_0010453531 /DNA_START=66 /DNA_END=278 /DNA_ORIENTATION=-
MAVRVQLVRVVVQRRLTLRASIPVRAPHLTSRGRGRPEAGQKRCEFLFAVGAAPARVAAHRLLTPRTAAA